MKIFNSQQDAPDKPPVLFVTLLVVFTFAFVFGFWFVAEGFLNKFTNYKEAKMETGMGNKIRMNYIEKETTYLNSANTKSDSHKIPIEEAMAKVIEKENK